MNQRSALLIAAALTAFLLVLAGGLASRLATTAELMATATDVAPTEAAPPTAVVALDPTVEALIKDRETSYQQALTEANNRLNQANAEIAQANAQISTLEQSRQQLADRLNAAQAAPVTVAVAPAAAPTAPPAAPAPAAPTYAVSAEQALSIAQGVAAPGVSLLKNPELVNYQGTPAYEIAFDRGMVYVDAQSGAVLANSAAAPQLISQDQAIQAATAYIGGGTIKSVSLNDDNGAQTYEVHFSDESKVYVDAVSGQVVYAEIRTNTSQYASGEHEGGEHEGGEHEGGEHDDD